jgi:hypothetical protein
MSSQYKLASLAAAACAVVTTVVSAQAPLPPAPPLAATGPEDTLFFLQNVAPLPAFGAQIDIIRPEASIAGPVVKGKPYSARSITESTQTLADGNRIVQRNEAVLFRDSEGRTRREQTLGGVGQWQTGEPVTTIHIHDPVADKTYVLDPDARTASEIRRFTMAIAHAERIETGKVGIETPIQVDAGIAGVPVPTPPLRTIVTTGASPVMVAGSGGDLGEQVLEGLLVQGTRMTDTIPAGLLGNERPIEIVTERWYSKDIDAMVLQRFSDPRVGETTYRLVNVALGDPSPDLFEVPQGYELVEAVDQGPARVRALRAAPGAGVEWEVRPEAGEPAR